jgi:hypothetical protein
MAEGPDPESRSIDAPPNHPRLTPRGCTSALAPLKKRTRAGHSSAAPRHRLKSVAGRELIENRGNKTTNAIEYAATTSRVKRGGKEVAWGGGGDGVRCV